MAVLRLQRPLWLQQRSAGNARSYPPLSTSLRVDVVILGGGVTGAVAAWRLASAGFRVAVLEAGRVGRGSTAASTALLMQEPDEDFAALRARYGARATKEIWKGVACVRDYFEQLYPALKDVRTDAWEGLFTTTPDGLPYIGPHRRYPRHLFALRYGGNGMTFGFLAARLLLEQLSGSPSTDHELFGFGRNR